MIHQSLSLILLTGAMLTPLAMGVRPLQAQPTINPRHLKLIPRPPIV